MTTMLEDRPATQAGDTDRDDVLAHIVPMPGWKVTEAVLLGTPVTALCGKTWVPHRDPEGRPVCPACSDVARALGAGEVKP